MTVRRDAARSRFVRAEDGAEAFLEYRLEGDRLVIVHTEVPPELGDRGIGSSLVEAAVEDARAEGRGIVVECAFAASWLRRHVDAVADLSIEERDQH